eukprot:scaffold70038_cov18-Tisochrysis_lutea.AAC.1
MTIADRFGLWTLPGQRAFPPAHDHHRGKVHAEAESASLEVCQGLAAAAVAATSQAVLAEGADETLGRFMDYCTYGHMIDNVVLIVTGTLHERDVQ